MTPAEQASVASTMQAIGQDAGVWTADPSGALIQPPAPPLPNQADPSLHLFWQVSCGQVVGPVWLPVNPSSANLLGKRGPTVDTLYHLSEQVLAPALTVGVNPAEDGITGLESYFWLAGYNGQPIDEVTQTAGASIEIRATPRSFTWDFGDGSAVVTTTSVGQAYPAVSDIRHTYDVRSDRSPDAVNGRYQVTVTASFDVSFRVVVPGVNLPTSGWTTFASLGYQPIGSSAALSYKVDEVRSVLTG